MTGGILSPEAEQRLAAGAAKLKAAIEAGDAEIVEDLMSIAESSPFAVKVRENPMPCPRCGSWVARVSESPVGPGGIGERLWSQAIWETFNGRKHTLRRCEALQAMSS